MKEFKEFVKNNKKEIAIGAVTLVTGTVAIALGVKGIRSLKVTGNPVEMVGDIIDDDWRFKNVVDGFTTGKVNELWNESNYGNAIVQYFTIKDMGALGEDLKKIGGITDDTEVSAVLTFINTKIEI
jgi:hypothetical protein